MRTIAEQYGLAPLPGSISKWGRIFPLRREGSFVEPGSQKTYQHVDEWHVARVDRYAEKIVSRGA